MRAGTRGYFATVTGQLTVVIVATAVLGAAIAGLVQREAGWLLGGIVLIVIAVLGGLVGRFLTNRELDRHNNDSDILPS